MVAVQHPRLNKHTIKPQHRCSPQQNKAHGRGHAPSHELQACPAEQSEQASQHIEKQLPDKYGRHKPDQEQSRWYMPAAALRQQKQQYRSYIKNNDHTGCLSPGISRKPVIKGCCCPASQNKHSQTDSAGHTHPDSHLLHIHSPCDFISLLYYLKLTHSQARQTVKKCPGQKPYLLSRELLLFTDKL